jgi:methylated-DNA-[protein]-cysteine S-methyltransferase
MAQICIVYHKTPIGEMVLGDYDGELCLLDFRYRKMRAAVDRRLCAGLNSAMLEGDSELLQACAEQLDQYLGGERQAFDLPLLTVGSDFQKRVWQALMQVPYGETASYADLAHKIGQPNAVRAVASANGANAISVIIPCHRIIGSDGALVGYGGGLAAKKRLLALEGSWAEKPSQTRFAFAADQ